LIFYWLKISPFWLLFVGEILLQIALEKHLVKFILKIKSILNIWCHRKRTLDENLRNACFDLKIFALLFGDIYAFILSKSG